jgi:hypothetical protein
MNIIFAVLFFLAGMAIGFFAAALMAAAGRGDDYMERKDRGMIDPRD